MELNAYSGSGWVESECEWNYITDLVNELIIAGNYKCFKMIAADTEWYTYTVVDGGELPAKVLGIMLIFLNEILFITHFQLAEKVVSWMTGR